MKYLMSLVVLFFLSCTNQQSAPVTNGSQFDTAGYEMESVNGSGLKYIYKMYAPNEMAEEGYVKNGLQHGSWVTYNKDGWMELVNHFDNGILNGAQLKFNKRGQIIERKSFQNGKLTGLFVQFKNGKPLKEIMYKDGTVNGFIKEYSRSGKLLKFAEYKNNELHGSVETYNEDGKLVLQYKYDNGKKLSGGIVE